MSLLTPPALALEPGATPPFYELCLFIAGNSLRLLTAQRNLEAICHAYLVGRYTLTVVDVAQHPERAAEEGLLGLPCLVKRRPGLVRRLVGDFSEERRVLKALGLAV